MTIDDIRHFIVKMIREAAHVASGTHHFIDLARFLAGSPIEKLEVASASASSSGRIHDVAALQLRFVDGSIGNIQYLANGNRWFPKERIELFWDGRTLQIDNLRRLLGWGVSSIGRRGFLKQYKRHVQLLSAFFDAVRTGVAPPIPASEIYEVGRWSILPGRETHGVAEA
jgi:predicted dehydrogenase